MSGEEVIGEAADPDGTRVVLLVRVWRDKVLRDHAELDGYLPDVLRAVSAPDHVEPDPATSCGGASTCGERVRVGGCWWS